MAGRPRTRAKREAEASAQSSSPEQGSRARARSAPAAKPKPPARAKTAKAKPKGKGRKPGQHGPARPRFDPATDEDFAAFEAQLAKEGAQAEPMTPAQRIERDVSIVAGFALGLTTRTLAERYSLTPEQVGRIIDGHRARRRREAIPHSHDLLHDALEALEAQMERLTLAASKGGVSESAIVGAVRTWKECWTARLELLAIMGWVGRSPAEAQRAARAQDTMRRMLDALRARGVSQDVITEVADEILLPSGTAGGNVHAIEGRVAGGRA